MTPSLEGLPTKAKEARSPHEVRLAPMDTNPVFQCLGDFLWPTLGLFALQLKNHRSGSKSVCSLSVALILKRIDILKSTSPYFLLNKDKLPYSKKKTELKMENPPHNYRETNLVLQVRKEWGIRYKTVMTWSLPKNKEGC